MAMKLDYIQQEAVERAAHYRPLMEQVGRTLWQRPEVGPNEYHSAAFLIGLLEERGFAVRRGVCGFPTGFIGEFTQPCPDGGRAPVLSLLCEYDALPAMSTVHTGDSGHGCGHNLFAASAITTAALLQELAVKHRLPCTIRVYGTPAEEIYASKGYYAKNGLFDDVDLSVGFHAHDQTRVQYNTSAGTNFLRYTFHGTPAHAGNTPWLGRSALDAVEIMNVAVNFLREHVRPDTRMHYIIKHGGSAPNIVPELAVSDYYLRAADMPYLEEVTQRVNTIAQAAAMAAGCTVDIQLRDQLYDLVLVREYCQLAQEALEAVGAPPYSQEELEAARAYGGGQGLDTRLHPLPDAEGYEGGSTDEGDVSWVVPHTTIWAANVARGTGGHTLPWTAQMDAPWAYTAAQTQVQATAVLLLGLIRQPQALSRLKEAHAQKMADRRYPKSGQLPPLFIFDDLPGVRFDGPQRLAAQPEELVLLRRDRPWELSVEDDRGTTLGFAAQGDDIRLDHPALPGQVVKLYARYPGGDKELLGYCRYPEE